MGTGAASGRGFGHIQCDPDSWNGIEHRGQVVAGSGTDLEHGGAVEHRIVGCDSRGHRIGDRREMSPDLERGTRVQHRRGIAGHFRRRTGQQTDITLFGDVETVPLSAAQRPIPRLHFGAAFRTGQQTGHISECGISW